MSITIYTKAYCGYCQTAKALLQQKDLDFDEIPVDFDQEKYQEMITRSQRRTVPQIFFGDTHIGGYTDLVGYFQKQGAEK